jgi:hypothetical protein
MSYSPILLGTPNNNDGDSLYVGGVKINANLTELYNAIGGSTSNTFLINFQNANGRGRGDILRWDSANSIYATASSDTLKTNASSGVSALFITNRVGLAGAENEFFGQVDSIYAMINSRPMFNLISRNTSNSVVTRGEMNFGLGLAQVTSVSIYTTSLVVRGSQGLQVFTASLEDVSSYTRLLLTAGGGIVLEGTPTVSGTAVRSIVDSSNSIAHTGMVQAAIAANVSKYTLSSTTVSAGHNLLGGGDLTTNRTIYLNPDYWPEYIDGFLYDVELSNTLRVMPGACAHFSYGTTGATRISETSVLSFVSTASPMTRTWTTGWSVTAGSAAIIDNVATPQLRTWYYIYLLGNAISGTTDFVVSAAREINTVSSLVFTASATSSIQIVRRIGAVLTDPVTTGALLRFTTQRAGGNVIRQNWLIPNGTALMTNTTSAGAAVAIAADTRLLTVVSTSSVSSTMLIIGSSTTLVNYNEFTSAIITQIPPIQGVNARLNIVHNPSASLPVMYFFGEAYFSSSTAAARSPNLQNVRSIVSGSLNYHTVTVPMMPDNAYIADSQLASISTTSGARIRQIFVSTVNSRLTSNSLHYVCEGFDLAR